MAFSGTRLAAGRRAARLTQQQLAELLGTEQTRVSDWERGLVVPRPPLIPLMAAAIGLDALEFLAVDPSAPALEDLRLAAGLTVQEAAAQAGISRRRYLGLEIGSTRRDPPDEVVERLARMFAVPVVTVRRAVEVARSST